MTLDDLIGAIKKELGGREPDAVNLMTARERLAQSNPEAFRQWEHEDNEYVDAEGPTFGDKLKTWCQESQPEQYVGNSPSDRWVTSDGTEGPTRPHKSQSHGVGWDGAKTLRGPKKRR